VSEQNVSVRELTGIVYTRALRFEYQIGYVYF